MKRNFTKQDIMKLLLQNYKKDLVKIEKEYNKVCSKQNKLKVLDFDLLMNYSNKDYSWLMQEKVKFEYNKHYVKVLNNILEWKRLSDNNDFLDKQCKDLQFEIYKLEQEIIEENKITSSGVDIVSILKKANVENLRIEEVK